MQYKMTWVGPRGPLEAAASFLSEIEPFGLRAVWLEKPADDVPDDAPEAFRLEADFDEAPDADALSSMLREVDARWTGLGRGVLSDVPDRDWVKHALEGLGIVRAGRFALYGVHDADKVGTDPRQIPIRIDANQAFGTGHHPTTAGCLSLLDRLHGLAPHSILDLGCGSGVLAIAAAKLWGRRVLAADIDPQSVEISRENAGLNGVEDAVGVVCADGFRHETIEAAAPFDFVFANILAGPLKGFALDMRSFVKPFGRVMLAGLMKAQEESVVDAYTAAGFRLINRLDHETWPVLLLVRDDR